RQKATWLWRYAFFIGLSIGLLAKGPLVLVLVGGPWLIWVLWPTTRRTAWQAVCALPWARGLLLTLMISLPWYIAAEIKTPGFLDYFIVGEHILRFIEPGWQGD